MAYLTVEQFKSYSASMPASDVDYLETHEPGFLAARLEVRSSFIDARCRKLYKVPFNPAPETVKGWLAALVTWDAFLKRGVNPSDPTMDRIKEDREEALAEIKEAADSKDGLFDLPLLEGADASAVAKAEPLAQSEASPYEWTDRQIELVDQEGAIDGR